MIYTLQDGFAHEFVFKQATRENVDAFCRQYEQVVAAHDNRKPLCLIIDARPEGPPPLNYLFAQIREIYGRHGRPRTIYSVYLYDDQKLVALVKMFLELMRLNATRLFLPGGTRAQALEWLHEQVGIAS